MKNILVKQGTDLHRWISLCATRGLMSREAKEQVAKAEEDAELEVVDRIADLLEQNHQVFFECSPRLFAPDHWLITMSINRRLVKLVASTDKNPEHVYPCFEKMLNRAAREMIKWSNAEQSNNLN